MSYETDVEIDQYSKDDTDYSVNLTAHETNKDKNESNVDYTNESEAKACLPLSV